MHFPFNFHLQIFSWRLESTTVHKFVMLRRTQQHFVSSITRRVSHGALSMSSSMRPSSAAKSPTISKSVPFQSTTGHKSFGTNTITKNRFCTMYLIFAHPLREMISLFIIFVIRERAVLVRGAARVTATTGVQLISELSRLYSTGVCLDAICYLFLFAH